MESAKNPQKSGGFVLPDGPAGQPAGGLGRPSVIPAPGQEQSPKPAPAKEPVVVLGGIPIDEPEEKPAPASAPAGERKPPERPVKGGVPVEEKPAPTPPVPEPVRRRKRPVMASPGQTVAVLVLGILTAFFLGTLAGVVLSGALWYSPEPVSPTEQTATQGQHRIPDGTGSSGDTQPSENTTDPQPSENEQTQPSEDTQPTDPQPAEDTQPSEPQPTEPQPAETQPTEPQPTETEPAQTEPDTSEYFFYDSDSRYLTFEDCRDLTRWQLVLARNEIFARHGRRFSNQDIQNYFDGCSWYEGTIAPEYFDSSVFNDYERYNINFLKSIEDSL